MARPTRGSRSGQRRRPTPPSSNSYWIARSAHRGRICWSCWPTRALTRRWSSSPGALLGTLRVTRDRETVGIYAFAIDPAWQGQGIGGDVLRRVCRTLADQGVTRIGLEVAVENNHALALYTSLGFVQVATEDYFALGLDSA